MTPDNVLKMHEFMMVEYDCSTSFLNPTDDLVTTKEKIAQYARRDVPNHTLISMAHHCNAEDGIKTKAASSKAYENAIASAQVKSAQNAESYKKEFRTTFEAALRVELYRQFIAKGPNLKELELKLKEKNPGATLTLASVTKYLIAELNIAIYAEFKKFEDAKNSLGNEEMDYHTIRIKEHLLSCALETFRGETNAIIENTTLDDEAKIAGIQQASLDYQISASALLRDQQIKTESNESWAPLLKNLLLLITGIGTLGAIVSMLCKAATGHYAFFDKPVLRDTPVEEMAPQDQLLQGPKRYS